MMENRQFLTSLDGSSNRNTPERSLSPVYSRNSTQERHNVFRCYQDENLITIKVEVKEEPEDPSVMDGEPCQEEAMPPEISTDTRDTQEDIKPEDEEEEHVRIKQEVEETYVVGHPCTEEEILPDISTDGSSNRNTPERSPSPPYSQDSTQEPHDVFQLYQDENLITIKVEVKEEAEDSSVMDGVPCQEETMPEISTDPQDTRETQGDIKPEDEEEGHVRIQEEAEETYVVDNPRMEEKILPGISTDVKRKPKEYSRELRDKVIELHNSGRGYKMISKCLHVPVYSVRSIIKKWKVHQTTETLPRKGRPSKLSEQTRIRLVREATERPSVTLDELQKTMIEAGIRVHKTTISRALNRTGLLLSKKHGFMNAVDDNG